MCVIRDPTLIPITGGERSTKKSKREDGRWAGDWASVWVEAEEGPKKYELVYDYAAGSIKKGKEAQRGRGSPPSFGRSQALTSGQPLILSPAAPRCGLQLEPALFFFFALRVISPKDRPKKKKKEKEKERKRRHHHNTRSPGRNHPRGTWSSSRVFACFSSSCTARPRSPCPRVSCTLRSADAPRSDPGRGSARLLLAVRL